MDQRQRSKALLNLAQFFRNCRSLVGAAATGRCEGSTIMSVLPQCEWCLSPAENVNVLSQTNRRVNKFTHIICRASFEHHSRTVTGLYLLNYSISITDDHGAWILSHFHYQPDRPPLLPASFTGPSIVVMCFTGIIIFVKVSCSLVQSFWQSFTCLHKKTYLMWRKLVGDF